jgi:hypothetical protein
MKAMPTFAAIVFHFVGMIKDFFLKAPVVTVSGQNFLIFLFPVSDTFICPTRVGQVFDPGRTGV